jgi:hypothetical protein
MQCVPLGRLQMVYYTDFWNVWQWQIGYLKRHLQYIHVLLEWESGIGDLEGISCAICRHRGWGSVAEVLATQRFPAPMAEE